MAITVNTPVITANGWMLAGSVRPGDIVFGLDGAPKAVTSVQTYDKGPTYEVMLDDKLTLCGDANMKFALETPNARDIIRKGFKAKLTTLSVQDLLDGPLQNKKNMFKYSAPTTKPIQLPETDLPVPPFIVGYWFAKCSTFKRFSIHVDELNEVTKLFRKHGYVVRRAARKHERLWLTIRPSIELSFLTKYSEKQTNIPDEYLLGSVEQRLELLRGLIHNRPNSFREKDKVYQYFSADYAFLKRIQGVVESLGVRTAMTEKPSGVRFRLFFKTDLPIGPSNELATGIVRFKRRFIRKITEIEPSERVYIEANGPFLAGEGFLGAC